ncbi:hypothetical protein N9369_01315 [Candidatus Pelagibacter sp.]|nr:hypothetical protein [Candidatus Pelagibacter sp.]
MNKLAKDEIDLSKIITIIFLNKFKILFITLITVIILSGIKQSQLQPSKKIFLIEAKIHPITIFDESKYQEYNAYIYNILQKESDRVENSLFQKPNTAKESFFKSDPYYKNFNQNTLKNNLEMIDGRYLYSLFISIISDEEKLMKLIRESNIIKKEKYQDNFSYEVAVEKLISTIKVADYDFLSTEKMKYSPLSFSNIQLQIEDKKAGVQLLNFIQERTNKEVKNHLIDEFNNLVLASNKLKAYSIEDIDFEISNKLQDEFAVSQLKILKKRINRNKDLERLEIEFKKTPIFLDTFFAGKFKNFSNKLLNEEESNFINDFFKYVILGLLLGLIYVMFENIRKKSKKKMKSY